MTLTVVIDELATAFLDFFLLEQKINRCYSSHIITEFGAMQPVQIDFSAKDKPSFRETALYTC